LGFAELADYLNALKVGITAKSRQYIGMNDYISVYRSVCFKLGLVFFFSFFSEMALASLNLPHQLVKADRVKVLEILGPSSSVKVLGNPYPLGGYSGLEVGYTLEVIPTGELATLGAKTPRQSETSFSNLTIGKGLYGNFDIVLQVTPLTQTEDVSSVGGMIRWGFYESKKFPAYLSVLIHGNYLNVQNQVVISNQGADLIMGVTVKDLSVYTGLGYLTTYGRFLGGVNSLNSEGSFVTEGSTSIWRGDSISEKVNSTHYLIGTNIQFQKVFLAIQMDRYSQSVFSGKLGMRF
jgi:hypothetical protein